MSTLPAGEPVGSEKHGEKSPRARPAGPPVRSQAIDDLIMGTNSSSITSKRSVEKLYYPDEPHYFRYFVKKFQRRAPLVNRGYWLRLRAIDVIVREFLSRPSNKKKVVVNLGCGSDVLPWQCHVRYPEASEGALFVDVDYPELMKKKVIIVRETPQLQQLVDSGNPQAIGPGDDKQVLLRSDKYCQIGCDLRDLDALKRSLQSLIDTSTSELLFVAEVSVTYMDTWSADALIQWASSMGQTEFCLLEQLLPHGVDHPFAQTMLNHFNKLKTPPRSVGAYPTLQSQHARFATRGWARVEIWDLWDAWGSDRFLSSSERAALDDVEPFDEWEEFMLFARHYFVLHATSTGTAGAVLQSPAPPSESETEFYQAEVKRHQTQAPKRRFGNALPVFNDLGQRFILHMMGLGTNGRAETYDMHALGNKDSTPPALPLAGPLARMCHSMTDLGDAGLLLCGGRTSPSSALSDCWLFKKGAPCQWQQAPRLPVALYRHAALRLGNSSLALVVGGKTGPARISSESYVYHPVRGWLRCVVRGGRPEPTFGSVLCNAVQPTEKPGIFSGLLAGGINGEGLMNHQQYIWTVDVSGSQPEISYREINSTPTNALSIFGAQTVDLGSCTAVCGGMGEDPDIQGQTVALLFVSGDDVRIKSLRFIVAADETVPFMIGSSVVRQGDELVVLGGGATCFSMGTFWDLGVYTIKVSKELCWQIPPASPSLSQAGISFSESVKVIGGGGGQREDHDSDGYNVKPAITEIPRVTLGQGTTFEDLVKDRKPVIIQGLDLGACLTKWTPGYMVERAGAETQVVVHECTRDTEKMDFNSKNFRYVTDSLGAVMARMAEGQRLYLRSLSRDRPSEAPADMARDFAPLAEDFCLPPEMGYVRDRQFSSVLRVSGRVNMWLHYDVMANVYTQIIGSKRMILFPPTDVTHLSFAPGASSSSLDVFTALDSTTGTLPASTHPHEATLSPGDVLFLPPMWLHTATPTSQASVAVNVFFRDLEDATEEGGGSSGGGASGTGFKWYAGGRDVYGNRDLGAYEKGRVEAGKIARGFEGLPGEIRRFYLGRIAEEMVQSVEGS